MEQNEELLEALADVMKRFYCAAGMSAPREFRFPVNGDDRRVVVTVRRQRKDNTGRLFEVVPESEIVGV